ncbi:MAG: bacillithiol biosynthesis cysteine-adding enzyme BshC [Cyclobacteriaceae bacterium]
MKLENVALDETNCFSPTFIDYINQEAGLKPFYDTFPTVENFKSLIESRNFPEASRKILADQLTIQYAGTNTSAAVESNIQSLKASKTFTITTGHQLNIFTGPLYFIYKIVTVINACKQLKAAYPEYHFVPVYWMATEDHDLAEISYFNLFGKKYQWHTDQTGPVGRMNPHSLKEVSDELPEKIALFQRAYTNCNRLADSVRYYVNELFGDEGLIVVDGDDAQLKGLFAPVIKEDLMHGIANALVNEASDSLEKAGYKNQAFSREINFFYLEDGVRERIVKEGGAFKVLNTELSFSEQEILTLVETNPEKFSPNVIMRPLYQETILPNLAYAGGPSEIAYWFQLKEAFAHHQVFFPALMPRVFGLVVNKANAKKVQKLNLSAVDLFKSSNDLKEAFLKTNSDRDYDLVAEKNALAELFEQIKNKGEEIDGSLVGFIGAEGAKALKSIDNIGKRLKRSEEQNNETAMTQLDNLKEKLFPNGGLQERTDNFLNFYLNNPNFIKELLEQFDAFSFKFHVLQDE